MSEEKPNQPENSYMQGLLIGPEVTGVMGQIAGMSVIIIGAGLALGIILDRTLGTKPMFTLAGILISLPLHMWLVYKIAMRAVTQIAVNQKKQNQTNLNSDQEDTLSE